VRQKKRKREAGDIGHDPDPVSREGSAEKATAGIQKKTNRSKAKGGDKVQGRDGSSERLPPGSRSAKPHTEEQRRDVAKQKDREKSGEAPKAPQARDLPGTYYGDQSGAGHCSFQFSNSFTLAWTTGVYTGVAVNEPQYGTSAPCGMCIAFWGTGPGDLLHTTPIMLHAHAYPLLHMEGNCAVYDHGCQNKTLL